MIASIDELFMLVMPEPTTGCWLWTRGCTGAGYPVCYERRAGRKVQRLVTRISEELARGPIGRDLQACHRCDTPQCVNPGHLFRGTMSDNMTDCVSKGRHRYVPNGRVGAAHHAARLTPEIVVACREAHGRGETIASLARRHGISESPMKNAVKGKTWRHV